MRFNQIIKFIFIIFPLTLYAAPDQDLARLLNSVDSMRAEFNQVIYDNRGKPVQRSTGKMAMMRPAKLRWNILQPIPQLVIANGSRIWIYDPDLQQVTIRPTNQVASDTPALLLSQVDEVLVNNYSVTKVDKKQNDLLWYQLVPKQKGNMFALLLFGFKEGRINQMHLKDHLGHTTIIQFQRVEINSHLPPALFTFHPPANVDVIDETRQIH